MARQFCFEIYLLLEKAESLVSSWSNNGVDVIFFSRSLVQLLGLTKHFSVSSTSAVECEWIEPGFYSFLTVSFSLNFLFFKFSFLCLQRHLYCLDMKSDLINAVQKTQNGHILQEDNWNASELIKISKIFSRLPALQNLKTT